MKTINQLQTKPSSRYDGLDHDQEGNKITKFADIIIDDRSLYQTLKKHDMVPSLGWGSEEHQRKMINYFLLNEMHEYLYYRYNISLSLVWR